MMKMNSAVLVALGIGAVCSSACKKGPAPARSEAPLAQLSMPGSNSGIAIPPAPAVSKIDTTKDRELNRLIEKKYAGNPSEKEAVLRDMARVNALEGAEEKRAEIYRRTMIIPAPANFKPEPVARKVRLRLVLEKSKLRKGERPRFRLEMTNTGQEAIVYEEYAPSLFVKGAGLIDSRVMHLYLTDSQGHRSEPIPAWGPDGTSPAGKSDARERSARDMSAVEREKPSTETAAMSEASTNFKVRLMPGETLHSIGDDDSPQENFRALRTEETFDTPGTYRLQVELDDRPRPMSKNYIAVNLRAGSTLKELRESHERRMRDALGPVSSNVTNYEVVR